MLMLGGCTRLYEEVVSKAKTDEGYSSLAVPISSFVFGMLNQITFCIHDVADISSCYRSCPQRVEVARQ